MSGGGAGGLVDGGGGADGARTSEATVRELVRRLPARIVKLWAPGARPLKVMGLAQRWKAEPSRLHATCFVVAAKRRTAVAAAGCAGGSASSTTAGAGRGLRGAHPKRRRARPRVGAGA